MVDEKWKTWTWADLRKHAIFKGLTKTTWEHRQRYLRMLEREYDVNLHSSPDEIYEKFKEYVEGTRLKYGKKAENRIKHAKNAVQLLFSYFGVVDKYSWPKTKEEKPIILIPSDNIVYTLIHSKGLHRDPLISLEINYIYSQASVLGPRPGAIPLMKTKGYDPETMTYTYYEPKVGQYRKAHLPAWIMTSRSDKSLYNWIYIHRPKLVDARSGDYLWLNQWGEPWNPDYLLRLLTKIGKNFWKPFTMYSLRHYAFTRYLVESYKKTGIFDIMGLKHFSGHEKMENVLRYVHLAEELVERQQREMQVGRIHKRHTAKKNNSMKLSPDYLSDAAQKSGRAHYSLIDRILNDNRVLEPIIDFPCCGGDIFAS